MMDEKKRDVIRNSVHEIINECTGGTVHSRTVASIDWVDKTCCLIVTVDRDPSHTLLGRLNDLAHVNDVEVSESPSSSKYAPKWDIIVHINRFSNRVVRFISNCFYRLGRNQFSIFFFIKLLIALCFLLYFGYYACLYIFDIYIF